MGNSTYTRQVEVPSDGREIAVVIPEGFLPVRVVNALRSNRWWELDHMDWKRSSVEATATATGEALLEGVGTAGGALAVSARGYQPAEEQLAEPPGFLHEIALMPVATATNLRPRVITTSGAPVPNAVVELISANPAAVPHVAVTDAKGVVAFSDVPSGSFQLIASADGFVTSTIRVGGDRTAEIVLTLPQGYRAIASVELAPMEGPQVLRVVNDANASMDSFLDSASDRSFEPPGLLSLGPLAPGAYAIELYGAAGAGRNESASSTATCTRRSGETTTDSLLKHLLSGRNRAYTPHREQSIEPTTSSTHHCRCCSPHGVPSPRAKRAIPSRERSVTKSFGRWWWTYPRMAVCSFRTTSFQMKFEFQNFHPRAPKDEETRCLFRRRT